MSAPSRVVLDTVPRVGVSVHGCPLPEGVPFPSCLRACLEYAGMRTGSLPYDVQASNWPVDSLYTLLMATSGASFRLLWNAHGWDGANVELVYTSTDPREPFLGAMNAAGSPGEVAFRSDFAASLGLSAESSEDATGIRRQIVESIRDHGLPVIALGVIGPPDACVVAGYDNNGGALLGWSFFQGRASAETEPSGMFRKADWEQSTVGLVLPGEAKGQPPFQETLRLALSRALFLIRIPRIGAFYSGLAAYEAWAADLGRDEEFDPADIANLWDNLVVHDAAALSVAEGRWHAAQFLREAACREPGLADDLLTAALGFALEYEMMTRIQDLVGSAGAGEARIHRLAEPAIRRQIIPMIIQARDLESRAAIGVERAIRQIGQ